MMCAAAGVALLTACSPLKAPRAAKPTPPEELRFHYSPTKEPGLLVMVKVFPAGEKPDPNWPIEVKPIPAEGLRVRARLGDRITIGVCLFNLCRDDLFIGNDDVSLRIEGGAEPGYMAGVSYPERFTLLAGLEKAGIQGRDDNFEMYLRRVTLPTKNRLRPAVGQSSKLELTLRWCFYYYRVGDPKRYFKSEDKKVELTLLE